MSESIINRDLRQLSDLQVRVLWNIYRQGPNCAKFIARQLRIDLSTAMEILEELREQGFLKRVEGRFLRPKGRRKVKHMNHTYYELSRAARLALRRSLLDSL